MYILYILPNAFSEESPERRRGDEIEGELAVGEGVFLPRPRRWKCGGDVYEAEDGTGLADPDEIGGGCTAAAETDKVAGARDYTAEPRRRESDPSDGRYGGGSDHGGASAVREGGARAGASVHRSLRLSPALLSI